MVLHGQFPAEAIYDVSGDILASYAAFMSMEPYQRARFRVIQGHIPYGVHEYVDGPFAYFTFLRDPIERTLSHYYYLREEDSHPLSEQLRENKLTLDECIELKVDKMMFNPHTRLLSGVWYDPPPGRCTVEHLEMAKENLRRHFKVVGLTERFDESLILLKRAFKWKRVHYATLNVTSERPSKDELPSTTLSAVESANRMDMELYSYGQELFAEQMSGRERQIASEVRRLHLTNYLAKLTFPIRRRSLRTFIKERWIDRSG